MNPPRFHSLLLPQLFAKLSIEEEALSVDGTEAKERRISFSNDEETKKQVTYSS